MTKKIQWLRLNYKGIVVDLTSDQLIETRKQVREELDTNPEVEAIIESIMKAVITAIKSTSQLSEEERENLVSDIILMALFEEAIDGTALKLKPILTGDVGSLKRKLKIIKH